MCYSVYISTDSPEDLTKHNSELVKFDRIADSEDNPCIGLLEFPHKWYIGSKAGCSCSFRHLMSVELGFSDPVDWYEEEQDDLDATRELYFILNELLSKDYHVDLIDSWHSVQPEDMVTIDVSFNDVSSTAFRLFENYKFKLIKKTQQVSPGDSQGRAIS